jgi:hypothetical protein
MSNSGHDCLASRCISSSPHPEVLPPTWSGGASKDAGPAPEQSSFEARRQSAEHLSIRLSVLAARFFAPEFCQSPRASHEAIRSERLKLFRQRNATYRLASSNKRRAERRQTHCRDARTQAARGTRHGVSGLRRPPLAGALACRHSTYGFHQRDFRPEGSASGQASRGRCESCGVPHASPSVTAMHLARRS